MKKLFILVVILILAGIVTIPLWTKKMAEKAFENIDDPRASTAAKEAIKMKMRIDDYASAQNYAEKAYIYFSDKGEDLPFFMYNAAVSAKKLDKPELAIFWYENFIRENPGHTWEEQAKVDLQKLKELHGK